MEYRQRSSKFVTLFKKKMLIGEISKQTDLTKDTIRFYEKKGLLEVERSKSDFNNYKHYTSEHLKRLQLIKKAKRFGFTLNEISELLQLFDYRNANCSFLQEKVNRKLIDIDKRIQELKEIKNLILTEIQKAQIDCQSNTEDDNCKILE